MPTITNDAQVILLLTSPLIKTAKNDIQPLAPSDWNRMAFWLRQKNLRPGDLLLGDPEMHLRGWMDKRCSVERILSLLGRGVVLGIAMEKWQRAGIWVLSRMDADYPHKLKDRLKENAPPMLYGCGNRKLLNADGVAVVGSRKATENDLKFTFALGESLARSGKTVVSGGARGIDEAAMSGAIRMDGTVVGILADSLLRASASQRYRQAILDKNVVLLSPYYPEAPFGVGNAMGRNKLIYCMADNAIVVHSGREGGTWNGALENLKKQWVPLWVKHSEDKQSGNSELVSHGGQWLPEDVLSTGLECLTTRDIAVEEKFQTAELLPLNVMTPLAHYDSKKDNKDAADTARSFYELFCLKLKTLLADGSKDEKVLKEKLELTSAQIKVWLQQAQDDGLIKKKIKPVRYTLPEHIDENQQITLF